jgi:hypothetical protein
MTRAILRTLSIIGAAVLLSAGNCFVTEPDRSTDADVIGQWTYTDSFTDRAYSVKFCRTEATIILYGTPAPNGVPGAYAGRANGRESCETGVNGPVWQAWTSPLVYMVEKSSFFMLFTDGSHCEAGGVIADPPNQITGQLQAIDSNCTAPGQFLMQR